MLDHLLWIFSQSTFCGVAMFHKRWIYASMITAVDIVNAVGRKNLADALGVGLTAVSNNVVKGQFPASWFFIVSKMAIEAGLECPPAVISKSGRV